MSQITNMLKGYEERVVEVLRGGFCVVRWMFQGCGILHDEKNRYSSIQLHPLEGLFRHDRGC